MKSKRVLATILAALTAGTVFTGCSGGNAESSSATSSMAASSTKTSSAATQKRLTGGGSKIIYVITPSLSNPAFKAEGDYAAAKIKALGYQVKAVSHDDDANKQSEMFDSAIADKAAAIICDNAGADATLAAVKKAADANIPTFLIDREINQSGVAIAQIVANNYQGAKGIAEKFVEAMGEKGEYAELKGKDSDTNAGVRSSAFHEVIDQYTDMKCVETQTANWEQTQAYDKTETILQSHPNIKGIICGNDTMAVGAAAAVKESGKKGINIIGVDGSDEAAAQIASGNMVGTALQQFKVIAETAVQEADQYLKTGSTGKEEKQLIDCAIITKDNVSKLKNFSVSD